MTKNFWKGNVRVNNGSWINKTENHDCKNRNESKVTLQRPSKPASIINNNKTICIFNTILSTLNKVKKKTSI